MWTLKIDLAVIVTQNRCSTQSVIPSTDLVGTGGFCQKSPNYPNRSLDVCLIHHPPPLPKTFFWTPDLSPPPPIENCAETSLYTERLPSPSVRQWLQQCCRQQQTTLFVATKILALVLVVPFDWFKRQKESNLAKNKCMGNRTQDARYP